MLGPGFAACTRALRMAVAVAFEGESCVLGGAAGAFHVSALPLWVCGVPAWPQSVSVPVLMKGKAAVALFCLEQRQ